MLSLWSDFVVFQSVDWREELLLQGLQWGWFHRFKLHIIINDKGELFSFAVTQANVDDKELLKNEDFFECFLNHFFWRLLFSFQ
ncbi:DDE family transposase [Flavobacterium circumlabens]|uniref:DDE family transposase n=2 Tax=Flavobacterium circumlabens TaxID=2133765 RepID=A0ABY2B0W9_9FLAO|nr:DDE family transposase [Flavobacterium circumlabens]